MYKPVWFKTGFWSGYDRFLSILVGFLVVLFGLEPIAKVRIRTWSWHTVSIDFKSVWFWFGVSARFKNLFLCAPMTMRLWIVYVAILVNHSLAHSDCDCWGLSIQLGYVPRSINRVLFQKQYEPMRYTSNNQITIGKPPSYIEHVTFLKCLTPSSCELLFFNILANTVTSWIF